MRSCVGQRRLCSCSITLQKEKHRYVLAVGPFGFIFWGPWTSYTCVSLFFSGLGKFSAIISSNTFLIPFFILLLLGSLLHIDQQAFYYPIGLLYYNLLKKTLASWLLSWWGISCLPDNVFALLHHSVCCFFAIYSAIYIAQLLSWWMSFPIFLIFSLWFPVAFLQ